MHTKHKDSHHNCCLAAAVLDLQRQLTKLEELLMTTTADLSADLATIKTNLTEAVAEIVAKVADLEAQLANAGQLPADTAQTVADIKALAQNLADVVPNSVS